MSANATVHDAYGFDGLVTVILTPASYLEGAPNLAVELSPDEARLLGLKLLRFADQEEMTPS